MMIRTSSEDAAVMAIQILILYTPWLFVQGHFSVRVRDSNAMHPLGNRMRPDGGGGVFCEDGGCR